MNPTTAYHHSNKIEVDDGLQAKTLNAFPDRCESVWIIVSFLVISLSLRLLLPQSAPLAV